MTSGKEVGPVGSGGRAVKTLRIARRMTSGVLLILTVGGLIYTLASLREVRRLLHAGPPPVDDPLRDPPDDAYTRPVSILKPVRGVDFGAEETFSGLMRQDYPRYEVLFAVADPDDAAIPMIEMVRARHPEIPCRLLVSAARRPNPKVALLEEMVAEARHDVLVMADSDVRTGPDYLRRVVAPLSDPGVGLVTCLYRATHAQNLAARLEALYLGVSFLPSAALGRMVLGMRFALGATTVIRRETVAEIGGLASVAGYLADDYQLGARTAATGLRVELAPYVVELPLGALHMRDVWHSEVRWARCSRVSRPVEYPGLLFTLPLPLALLWRLARGRGRAGARLVPGISLAVRLTAAWMVTGYTDDRELRPWLALLPVRDVLTAVVFATAAFGRRVEWRGVRYHVGRDGHMVRLPG